jgi:predicted PurR-regulated permease PerM
MIAITILLSLIVCLACYSVICIHLVQTFIQQLANQINKRDCIEQKSKLLTMKIAALKRKIDLLRSKQYNMNRLSYTLENKSNAVDQTEIR